jgi:alpha-glucosidase
LLLTPENKIFQRQNHQEVSMCRNVLFFLVCTFLPACSASSQVFFTSPSGILVVGFSVDSGGVPWWQIQRDGKSLLSWSPLGLTFLKGGSLASHFILLGSEITEHDEKYDLVAGKTKHARDHHRELRVQLQESAPAGRRLDLTFRAFDDGVAFRYTLPPQGGMTDFDIVRENTEFRFPEDMKAWAFQINTFHSSFEGLYLPTTLADIPEAGEVYPPLTMQRADGVTLSITEAELRDYAGMYFRGIQGNGLRVVLSPHPDGSGVCVHASTPFSSPWRVIMIGERPGGLIESTIIANLSSPCALDDVSWIKPGKAIFPWWPDFYSDKPGVPSTLDFENQKYYIDFAAENNLGYLEMEPPWYGDTDDCINNPRNHDITKPIPGLRLPELFAYAKSKGVGIFLWAHWDNVDRQGDSAFALFQKWGAAGVKIDFMNRDDQEMVRWYQTTLQKAAAHRLMVLYHGAYKPTGLQRTFPHLLTQEGVFGNEQNKVTKLVTPAHTVTLPFTRMLAGPMDFTPGGFRNVTAEEFRPDYSRPMVMGTRCHQLAMFVVYDSPLMMVCDDPGAYRNQPGLAFIRDVPATWDETRVVQGRIAEYIVTARRSGDEWYLGGMTDWTPRQLSIPLSFLGNGAFEAEIFQDAADADAHPTGVSIMKRAMTWQDSLRVRMASGGGLAVHFVKR